MKSCIFAPLGNHEKPLFVGIYQGIIKGFLGGVAFRPSTVCFILEQRRIVSRLVFFFPAYNAQHPMTASNPHVQSYHSKEIAKRPRLFEHRARTPLIFCRDPLL